MSRNLHLVVLVSLAALPASRLNAASSVEARVTQISKTVQLLAPKTAARSASLSDNVREGTTVRTVGDSSVELTFFDGTIVRLAANTAFSFERGTHDLNLGAGAVLVQASEGARGARIHAGDAAAAITGTTVMCEYHAGVCKFLVLEGTGRFYRPGHLGDSVLVRPGQMVIGKPSDPVSDPVDFDIGRFVRTSRLIINHRPLPSEQLIAAETRKQQREKSKKTLIDTNLVIFGGGTLVSITKPTQTNGAGAKPGPNGIPASTDLGSVQTPPSLSNPASNPSGLNAVDQAADSRR